MARNFLAPRGPLAPSGPADLTASSPIRHYPNVNCVNCWSIKLSEDRIVQVDRLLTLGWHNNHLNDGIHDSWHSEGWQSVGKLCDFLPPGGRGTK